jgi:crotonobetainyl-CoA:carnitine CoA-transferase CaiB-like acyl-CoA transferase
MWTMLATPADFEAHRAGPRFRAPELGEHTHEVLAELGRSDAEIAALEASGITAAACDTATA